MHRTAAIMMAGVVLAAVVPGSRAADIVIYLSDQNLDAIVRIQDINRDGDTLDAGEVITFVDDDPPETGIENCQGMVLLGLDDILATDNFPPQNVIHLRDLNGDHDALEPGEATAWFDGTLPGSLTLDMPVALTPGPFESIYLVDNPYEPDTTNPDAIYRMQDLNGDGDVNDADEVTEWIRFSEPGEILYTTYDLDFDLDGYGYFADSSVPTPWQLMRIDPETHDITVWADDDEVLGQLGYHLAIGGGSGGVTLDPYTNEILIGGYYGISTAVLLALRDDNGDGRIQPLSEIRLLWDQATPTHTAYVNEPRDLYFLPDGSLLWVDMLYDQVLRLVDVNRDGDYDDSSETRIVYRADWAAPGQPVADRPQTVVGIVVTAPGDMDDDDDVDLDDYVVFAPCMAGPNETLPPAGCHYLDFACADLDDDGDVDAADFAWFQRAFLGGD